MRKEPMTAPEARENIAAMLAETSKAARVRMLKLALKIGNLSDAARVVYRDQLQKDAGQ